MQPNSIGGVLGEEIGAIKEETAFTPHNRFSWTIGLFGSVVHAQFLGKQGRVIEIADVINIVEWVCIRLPGIVMNIGVIYIWILFAVPK